MTTLELTFGTDDPEIARMLAEINRMPRYDPARLELEAALCQWWANRCLVEAGEIRGRIAARRRSRS